MQKTADTLLHITPSASETFLSYDLPISKNRTVVLLEPEAI